jgi:hypothetical protein
MRYPLVVGVDTHRKANQLHCMDPTGQRLDAFSQSNNRPGTQQTIARLVALLEQNQFDGVRIAAEATNW